METREESEKLMLAAVFIRESNLIESVDIPLQAILIQLGYHDPKTSFGGHAGALLSANENAAENKPITERMARDWQGLIIEEQNAICANTENLISGRHVGHYRDCGVSVGNKICPPAKTVPSKMKRLIRAINAFQARKNAKNPPGRNEIIEQLAAFHFWFLIIHPFVDGNGRTGRLLAWYLFIYFDLTPFVFTNYDKYKTYYRTFEKGTSNRMKIYFLNKMNSPKVA